MHTQSSGTRRKPQTVALQWLTVEIDAKPFGDLDFNPRQTRAHEHVVDTEPVAEQIFQRANQLLRGWQNADIQKTVVHQRFRAQHMPATRLTAIADPQRQQLALPVKIRPRRALVHSYLRWIPVVYS